jgi:hypothetical protein
MQLRDLSSIQIQHQVGGSSHSEHLSHHEVMPNNFFLKGEGLEAESKVEISFKSQGS